MGWTIWNSFVEQKGRKTSDLVKSLDLDLPASLLGIEKSSGKSLETSWDIKKSIKLNANIWFC